jgi:hypothetical protein
LFLAAILPYSRRADIPVRSSAGASKRPGMLPDQQLFESCGRRECPRADQILWLIVLVLTFAGTAYCEEIRAPSFDSPSWPGAELFTNREVRQIQIQINSRDLEKLRRESREFVRATLTEANLTLADFTRAKAGQSGPVVGPGSAGPLDRRQRRGLCRSRRRRCRARVARVNHDMIYRVWMLWVTAPEATAVVRPLRARQGRHRTADPAGIPD